MVRDVGPVPCSGLKALGEEPWVRGKSSQEQKSRREVVCVLGVQLLHGQRKTSILLSESASQTEG